VIVAYKLHAFRTLKVDIVQSRPFIIVVGRTFVPVCHLCFVQCHASLEVVEKQGHPFLVAGLLLELSYKGGAAVFDVVDAMALCCHIGFRYLVLFLRPQVLLLVGATKHRDLGVAVELALASVVLALTLLGVGSGGLQGGLVGLDLLGIITNGVLELLAMVMQSGPFLFMLLC
jgi:hypothetical protein